MTNNKGIPVYSLDTFRASGKNIGLYQVEVFDANRHFKVSYPHRHDFYEILYLTNGSGYHIIDSNKYIIDPPCVFFLSPGQAHKLELSHDIAGYIFLFTTDFYQNSQKDKNRLLEYPFFFSVEQNNPPLALSDSQNNLFLKSLFVRACTEVELKNKSYEDILRTLLDLILLLCDQLYPDELRSVQKGKGYILVKSFLLLIEENYQRNLRVNDYAQMLKVTPNHLTQMVKEITGRTSTSLIQDKTIAEIKRLLIHTNMNITEIAEVMHFQDQSYFTKYFKNCVGISPKDYRNKSIKNT